MCTYLGVDLGHEALKLAVADERGKVLAGASVLHRGDPLGALLRLLKREGLAERLDATALATGTGSGLIAHALGFSEIGEITAAAAGVAALLPGAGSILLVGAENAALALAGRSPGIEPHLADIRFAGPDAAGVGRLLTRWTRDPAPPQEGRARAAGRVSCRGVADAHEDLDMLRLTGTPPGDLAVLAIRAAARIIAAGIVGGGPVRTPVALVGGPALVPGLALELDRALGLPGGSVVVPDRAELAPAIGAARLAAIRGGRADFSRLAPPEDASEPAAASHGKPKDDKRAGAGATARAAGIGVDVGLREVRVAAVDGEGRTLVLSREPIGEEGAIATARDAVASLRAPSVPVAATGRLSDEVSGALDGCRPLTRASALAGFAAREGHDLAVELGGGECCLVRLDSDRGGDARLAEAVYPGSAGRSMGRAIEEASSALGLADPAELGRLAGSAPQGAWLRDRGPETIRSDAAARLVTGEPRSEVARGVIEAAARGARKALAEKSPPRGRMLLAGGVARVPGMDAAVARAFACEVQTAADPEYAAATGAALVAARPAPREDRSGASPGADGLAALDEILARHTPAKARGARFGRMGLPVSLAGARRGPFWATFLVEVGFDVVTVEDAPGEEVAARAEARTAGAVCGAVQTLRAEVEALSSKGVAAAFLPVEVDAARPFDGFDGVLYNCPFLQAGAYLAPVGGVRVVSPLQFHAFSEHGGEESIARALAPWRVAPGAVRRALRVAAEAQGDFEDDLRSRGEEMLTELGADGRAVVLLGRTYSARSLPAGVAGALRADGVALVPQDLLPVGEDDLREAARGMHWDCGLRILAAARRVAREARLGAVYLTHPRCGPDSFVKKYAREILPPRRWMLIELDGRAEARHLVERARAFRVAWDANASPARPEPSSERKKALASCEIAGPSVALKSRPITQFPDLGVVATAGTAVLEGFGVPAGILHADEDSLRAAAGYTGGDECLPYVATIGNLVKTVEAPGFDPTGTAFFMAASSGSCRFAQYPRGFRQTMDALGIEQTHLVSLNQAGGGNVKLGLAFGLMLWEGVMALGAIEDIGRRLRARARNRRAAEDAVERSRQIVIERLRRKRPAAGVLRRVAGVLGEVDLDPGGAPVAVAMTGEIFARSQGFLNSHVVDLVEAAGAEMVVPPFQEWIYHVNKCVQLFAAAQGKTLSRLKLRAVRWQLERVEKRVWKALAGAPAPAPQPSVEEVWRCAYEAGFIPWFGDASLALGRAIAMRRRGARGLVNVVPHGCLPGTTSQAAFASRRGALKGMPILHLVVDGAPAAEVRAQVLSFLDAVRAYRVPDYSPALLRRPHARAFVTA